MKYCRGERSWPRHLLKAWLRETLEKTVHNLRKTLSTNANADEKMAKVKGGMNFGGDEKRTKRTNGYNTKGVREISTRRWDEIKGRAPNQRGQTSKMITWVFFDERKLGIKDIKAEKQSGRPRQFSRGKRWRVGWCVTGKTVVSRQKRAKLKERKYDLG